MWKSGEVYILGKKYPRWGWVGAFCGDWRWVKGLDKGIFGWDFRCGVRNFKG